MQRMDQRKLGNLALVAVACAWGTMIPVITYLAHTWDPFFLGAVRYVGGVPLLYVALWMTEGFARPAVRPALWRSLLPGWFGLGGFAPLGGRRGPRQDGEAQQAHQHAPPDVRQTAHKASLFMPEAPVEI